MIHVNLSAPLCNALVRLSGKKRKPRLARSTFTKGHEGKINLKIKKMIHVTLCAPLCNALPAVRQFRRACPTGISQAGFVRLCGKKHLTTKSREVHSRRDTKEKLKKNNLKKILCVRRGGLCDTLSAPLW